MPLKRHLQQTVHSDASEHSSVSPDQQGDLQLTFHVLGQFLVDTELLSRSDQMEAKIIGLYRQNFPVYGTITEVTRCVCGEFQCCY